VDALLLFVGLGYLVGLPVLAWCLRDLGAIPRSLWPGYGKRDVWQRRAIACYALAGWPVIVFALGWRTSLTRTGLIEDQARMRESVGHD
jgi:hypothetical protein